MIGGIGNGTQWASVDTAVHRLVDEAFRTRTAAVLESLAAIAPGVGIVVGGALTALFSPRAAYLAAGLGLLALIAVARLTHLEARERGERAPVEVALETGRGEQHGLEHARHARPAPLVTGLDVDDQHVVA